MVLTVRRRDATLPSSSVTALMPPRPHGRTVVKLRVVHTGYPGQLDDRAVHCGHKREALLPRTADTKASYPSELGITTALVLPLASLDHPATGHLSPLFHPSPSKLFLHLRPRRRKEAQE
jgi:hypothetical protein